MDVEFMNLFREWIRAEIDLRIRVKELENLGTNIAPNSNEADALFAKLVEEFNK